MSNISQLASIAVNSSAAGFGLSGGRDIYRSLGKSFWYILAFSLAIAGAGAAMFFLRRGTNRGWVGTIFLLFIPNLLLLTASTAVVCVFAMIPFPEGSRSQAIPYVLAYQSATMVVGFLLANSARRQRQFIHAVEMHNRRFLGGIGFRDVGGQHGTWLDEKDRELVVHDRRQDAIVFRILNERGGRSMIKIDDMGRMMQYVSG